LGLIIQGRERIELLAEHEKGERFVAWDRLRWENLLSLIGRQVEGFPLHCTPSWPQGWKKGRGILPDTSTINYTTQAVAPFT